ncbi:MAG: tetratricopeptide repeat protein, partial [Candidatus Izemoplasmatales bacterium]|nr:tetratricopeptide repeat protein [Candidatus Izemoplasmatales bacterium]
RYFSSLIQDFSKSNLVPDAYYALGSTYEDEGRCQEAVDYFEKVIELGESDLAGQAAIAIAGIYVKQDKLSLAIKTYQDVINVYPNLTNLIYPKIGDIYYNMSRYEDALLFYRRSLDIVPVRQMADIQFKIAEVFQAQGRAKEAVEEYLKITYLYAQNKDLNVKALLRVASIYEGEENFKEALAIYQKIASMDAEEAKYAREKISRLKEVLIEKRR